MKLTSELVGKTVLRSEPTVSKNENYLTEPMIVKKITETHFYFSLPEGTQDLEFIEARYYFDDDKWVLYEDIDKSI